MTSTVEGRRQRAGGGSGSTIRVLVAVESTRERALFAALQSATPAPGGAFLVVRRCTTAAALEASLMQDDADAVLIGEGLFGLDGATLARCADAGLPTVVLGAAPGTPRPGILQLPSETALGHVCGVLAAAVWGTTGELADALQTAGIASAPPASGDAPLPSSDELGRSPARTGGVFVVVGPPRGNVGASRASIELVAAREREPSLLIDAVLDEPSVAAALGLNPARNLTVLAAGVAVRAGPEHWARALRDEIQPLDRERCPRAAVLAGVPSPALRSRLDPEFLVDLVTHASGLGGFGCLVVDAGAEPPAGTLEGACWRALVDLADRVLVVAMPDVIGLRRALGTLERLEARVGQERLGVILNRYRRGEHDDPADIAAVLRGTPVVAVVPDDVRGCTRALRLQQPLLSVGRSAAARELRRLADQLHAAPAASPRLRRGRRLRWWPWRRH